MAMKEAVEAFIDQIQNGYTLEAIQTFYAPSVVQYENNAEIIHGKDGLYKREIQNLASVNTQKTSIRKVVIDENNGMVWGEMCIEFDSKKYGIKTLVEAFFQRWENNQIIEQRFYYQGFFD